MLPPPVSLKGFVYLGKNLSKEVVTTMFPLLVGVVRIATKTDCARYCAEYLKASASTVAEIASKNSSYAFLQQMEARIGESLIKQADELALKVLAKEMASNKLVETLKEPVTLLGVTGMGLVGSFNASKASQVAGESPPQYPSGAFVQTDPPSYPGSSTEPSSSGSPRLPVSFSPVSVTTDVTVGTAFKVIGSSEIEVPLMEMECVRGVKRVAVLAALPVRCAWFERRQARAFAAREEPQPTAAPAGEAGAGAVGPAARPPVVQGVLGAPSAQEPEDNAAGRTYDSGTGRTETHEHAAYRFYRGQRKGLKGILNNAYDDTTAYIQEHPLESTLYVAGGICVIVVSVYVTKKLFFFLFARDHGNSSVEKPTQQSPETISGEASSNISSTTPSGADADVTNITPTTPPSDAFGPDKVVPLGPEKLIEPAGTGLEYWGPIVINYLKAKFPITLVKGGLYALKTHVPEVLSVISVIGLIALIVIYHQKKAAFELQQSA